MPAPRYFNTPTHAGLNRVSCFAKLKETKLRQSQKLCLKIVQNGAHCDCKGRETTFFVAEKKK